MQSRTASSRNATAQRAIAVGVGVEFDATTSMHLSNQET